MNCSAPDQDLTLVWCGVCLLVGIIVGRWVTYAETPPDED
jgi:uncharacterized protein YneF (UPF0154 family)